MVNFRSTHTQTEVPAPWSEPMVTRPKIWINKTATTTATQTDILIRLTLDEPWVEHVVEHPRSPADNKLTFDLVRYTPLGTKPSTFLAQVIAKPEFLTKMRRVTLTLSLNK